MSFSIQKIIIVSLLNIYFLYGVDVKKNISKTPILYNCNYPHYNVADIQLAKSSHMSWEKGKYHGYFTAIAYRKGIEHGCSLVRVLITQVDEFGSVSDTHVIKDIQIGSPGIAGYIKDIDLNVINNKLSLGIDIKTRIEPRLIVKQVLMIDVDGNVSNIIPFNLPANIGEPFYAK